MDCYKRSHFILEAKKLKIGSHTKGYDDALLRAHAQAQNYASALPTAEGQPPIILVVDVGNVIQVFSEFSRTGGNYIPYPDPRSHQIKLQWALSSGGTLEDRPRYNKSVCFETFPSDDTGLTPELNERIRHLAEQLDAHRKTQQAAHPDLTLTGMDNVLEKLRSGEAINGKDKTIHEQGLVSVLRTLHDELDAAVLAAYGWSDHGPVPWGDEAARAAWTDALLQRLVDLNTRRALEEASGTVRWLRPEFQNPAKPAAAAIGEQTDMDLGLGDDDAATRPARSAAPTTQQAWPSTLPEQIKAVAEVLSAAPTTLDMDAIATHFKGKGRWRERLPMILETLVAIGRADSDGQHWHAQ